MALVGNWLHFSYADMLEMEIDTLLMFIDEIDRLASENKGGG